MGKGSSFEREICKALSDWWTGGADSDVFWRTANSGGRATVRRKKGKNSKHHNGDVDAIDPIGKPLIDLLTLELKRGYSRSTFADLLDKLPRAKAQQWEEWILKARTTQELAGSAFWFLVARRDRRECLCCFPYELTEALRDLGCWASANGAPVANLSVNVGKTKVKMTVKRLTDWLRCVTPAHIRHLARTC